MARSTRMTGLSGAAAVTMILAISSIWLGPTFTGAGLWTYYRVRNGTKIEVNRTTLYIYNYWWIGSIENREVTVQRIPKAGQDLYWTTNIFAASKSGMCGILTASGWNIETCPPQGSGKIWSVTSTCTKLSHGICRSSKSALYFPNRRIGAVTIDVAPKDIPTLTRAIKSIVDGK